jgi:hypothetical protein
MVDACSYSYMNCERLATCPSNTRLVRRARRCCGRLDLWHIMVDYTDSGSNRKPCGDILRDSVLD